MTSLMGRALDLAEQKGAQFTDIRVVDNLAETISLKNGVPC
jgi:predicted Zn-dependent protease